MSKLKNYWKKYVGGVKDDLSDPMTYTSFLDNYDTSIESPEIEPFSNIEEGLANINRGLDRVGAYGPPEKRSGFDWLKDVYSNTRDTIRPFTDPIAKYGGKALGIAKKGYDFLPDDLKSALAAKYSGMYNSNRDRFEGLRGKHRGQRVGLNLSGGNKGLPAAGRVQSSSRNAYSANPLASNFINAAASNKSVIDQINKSYKAESTTKASGKTITLAAVGDISPSKYRKFS